MALKLDKVSYREIISNISYEFEERRINIILSSGLDKDYLGYLLTKKINQENGNISNTYAEKEIGTNINNIDILSNTIYEELSSQMIKYNYKLNMINKRVEESLKMVGLSSSHLDRKLFTLSDGELAKVKLAKMLILNPKLIVINTSNTLIDNRDENRLIRLLKKLKKDYHKTIVIITDNVSFALSLGDNYLILRNGKKVFSGNKNELIKDIDKLKKAHLNVPRIIDFIYTANKNKRINLELTDDIKELMKDIYRNV